MELWIRSQDKMLLRKPEQLGIYEGAEFWFIGESLLIDYGKYKTKERALEVLDEIQSVLKQQFIVKANVSMRNKDIDMEEIRLNYKYSKEFIMEDSGFEIIPVNSNVIIYEMPKE